MLASTCSPESPPAVGVVHIGTYVVEPSKMGRIVVVVVDVVVVVVEVVVVLVTVEVDLDAVVLLVDKVDAVK